MKAWVSAARTVAVVLAFGSAIEAKAQTPLAVEREPPLATRPMAPPPIPVPQPGGGLPVVETPVVPAPLVVPPGPPPVAVPAPVVPDPMPAPAVPPPPVAAPHPAPPPPTPPAQATPEAPPPVVTPPPAPVEPVPPPTPVVPPKPPAPVAEDVTLEARPVLFVTGITTWEAAEEKLGGVFTTLGKALEKLGIEATEGPLVEYIESDSDDVGFKAMVPIAAEPKGKLPKGVKFGRSPAGKALKFHHDGPIDDLEEVYTRIDDELGRRGLDAKSIVERFDANALASVEDRGVVDVYVLLK